MGSITHSSDSGRSLFLFDQSNPAVYKSDFLSGVLFEERTRLTAAEADANWLTQPDEATGFTGIYWGVVFAADPNTTNEDPREPVTGTSWWCLGKLAGPRGQTDPTEDDIHSWSEVQRIAPGGATYYLPPAGNNRMHVVARWDAPAVGNGEIAVLRVTLHFERIDVR